MSTTDRTLSTTDTDQRTAEPTAGSFNHGTAAVQQQQLPSGESRNGALRAEIELLNAHVALLAAHADAILANPEWHAVRSPITRFGLAYAGDSVLSLGELCQHWSRGALIYGAESEAPVWLYRGGGSPLSGRGACHGADASGVAHCVQGNPLHFGLRMTSRAARNQPDADLSLADVLVALGVSAPSTRFFMKDRVGVPEQSPSATYNPNNRTLNIAGTDIQLDSTPNDMNATGLKLLDGHIVGDDGRVRIYVEGPCPPPRALPLIEQQLRKEDR